MGCWICERVCSQNTTETTCHSTTQKLRRLPFSVRCAVTEELADLQAKGIIECIDASPWVSPIVVTQRRGGGKLNMCVDLREPNKSIVCDTYPLPHMDKLLTN